MSPRPTCRNMRAANTLICVLTIALLSVAQIGCTSSVQSCNCDIKMPALAGQADIPVVAIYRVTASMRAGISPEEREPQIVLAAWADGRVVWSGDEIRGGRPYYQGSIAPRRLNAFFEDLTRKDVSGERLQRHSYFGPDSDYLAISVCEGLYTLHLQSWHELFETRPNLVATSRAISPLGDKSREQVLAEQPEDYRLFREFWAVIRTSAKELMPDGQQPAENLHFEN